jgi:tetratricopeptide (TPR) repeat protein
VSAINQMLRDLDKRGVLAGAAAWVPTEPTAPGDLGAPPAPPSGAAGAYASARLRSKRSRWGRRLMLAGGVAALLPIAWAATRLDRGDITLHAAPATVAAVVRTAVEIAPTAAPAPAPVPTPAPTPAPAVVPAATTGVAPMATAAARTEAEPAASRRSEPSEPAPAREATVAAASVTAGATTGTEPTSMPLSARADVAPRRATAAATMAMPQAAPAAAPSVVAGAPAPQPRAQRNTAAPAGIDAATSRADAPREARLALANPAAPKDETRIERRPTDARDDLTRAGEAMSIGRTSDAIVLLRKVIQAEPDNERARLALLALLAERGRDDTWRSALADSARALPKRFGLAAAQGLAESGRYAESLAILQALPEAVRDARYHAALGATHQQLNQHGEAVAAFDAALASAPAGAAQLPSLLVAQALSMQSLGNEAGARRNLERVRQMPEAAADVREFASRELARGR